MAAILLRAGRSSLHPPVSGDGQPVSVPSDGHLEGPGGRITAMPGKKQHRNLPASSEGRRGAGRFKKTRRAALPDVTAEGRLAASPGAGRNGAW